LGAQLFEYRVWQGIGSIQPPFEAPLLLDDDAHRAVEIGRGLLDAVIEKALVERLPRPPDPRHTAVLRVQRAQMQRGAVDRNAGCQGAFAEADEQRGTIGCSSTAMRIGCSDWSNSSKGSSGWSPGGLCGRAAISCREAASATPVPQTCGLTRTPKAFAMSAIFLHSEMPPAAHTSGCA